MYLLSTYYTNSLNIAEEQNCNTGNEPAEFLGQYKIRFSACNCPVSQMCLT